MATPQKLQVRIIGAPGVINPLADALRKKEEDVTVISTEKVKDGAGFEFGLIEAAAIAAILSSGFALGSFSLTLFEFLRNAPDKRKTIKLVTSVGEVEIRASADLTEEDVKKLVASVVKSSA